MCLGPSTQGTTAQWPHSSRVRPQKEKEGDFSELFNLNRDNGRGGDRSYNGLFSVGPQLFGGGAFFLKIPSQNILSQDAVN